MAIGRRMKKNSRAGRRKEKTDRLRELERQLRKHNPDMKINYDLFKLVGTMPYNPPSQDKEIIRRIVAERYG